MNLAIDFDVNKIKYQKVCNDTVHTDLFVLWAPT